MNIKYVKSSPAIITLAVGTLIAIGSFWALELTERSGKNQKKKYNQNSPDFYVENFTYTKMSSNGETEYQISGKKLSHHPSDDSNTINFPIMKSFTKAGSEITLRADYAKVNSDSSELHLFKKVKFNQSKNLKNKAVLITSEYMLALPNQDIIKTDKNVAIKQGNSLLLGEGLFGNIVEQQFTLLSNVNGTFKNKK
tara:strand:+ start:38 stop:625 length:588 start_codon:yes stop_codon:yes gene_type:complete